MAEGLSGGKEVGCEWEKRGVEWGQRGVEGGKEGLSEWGSIH